MKRAKSVSTEASPPVSPVEEFPEKQPPQKAVSPLPPAPAPPASEGKPAEPTPAVSPEEMSYTPGPVVPPGPVSIPVAPVLSPELAAPISKESEELTEVEMVKKAREIAQGEGTPIEKLPEPPKTETGGASEHIGPGAATKVGKKIPQAGQVGAKYSNIAPIELLADAVSRFPVQKGSFRQKLSEWMDSAGIPVKNFFTRAMIMAKAAPLAIKEKLTTLKPITDLDRRVGVWSADEHDGGFGARQFANQVRRIFKDRSKLRALSNWIDAEGDKAVLQQRASQTKNAALRKTYEDAMNFGVEEADLAAEVKEYFDSMLALGQDEGALEEGLENYIHRYYRSNDPVLEKKLQALRYFRFSKDFAGFKKRFYETDFDAEQSGMFPEKDAARRILAYDHGFRAALTARAFVKSSFAADAVIADEFGSRPELDVAGIGIALGKTGGKYMTLIKPKHHGNGTEPEDYRGDYAKFDHPAFQKYKFATLDSAGNPILVQGEILVHPKVAAKYAALFERSWWSKGPVRRGALAVSSFVKQTMLVGPFHLVQITTGGVEHRINPFNLLDLTPNDPAQREMAEAGLFESGWGAGYYTDGVSGGGLLDKIPIAGEYFQAAKDWLFNDYIKRWKMTLALAIKRRSMEHYARELGLGIITPEQIVRTSAQQSAAVFGGQNQRAIFRSRSVQDTLRFLFLAPDFGEERLNQVFQAAGKYGMEQRLALLYGALGMLVLAKLIEQALTGQMRVDRPFTVTYHGKQYGLRNPSSDIFRFITSPMRYISARLNPVTMRPILEGLTGRDYFGKRRTGIQQVEDEAGQIIPIPLRGATSESQTLWDSFLSSCGITVRPDDEETRNKEKEGQQQQKKPRSLRLK